MGKKIPGQLYQERRCPVLWAMFIRLSRGAASPGHRWTTVSNGRGRQRTSSGCLLFSQSIAFYFWVVNDCVQKPTAKHILRCFVGCSSRLWDELVDSKDRVLSGMLQSMRQQLGRLERDDSSVQAFPRHLNSGTTPAFTQLKEVCVEPIPWDTSPVLCPDPAGRKCLRFSDWFPSGRCFLLWSA